MKEKGGETMCLKVSGRINAIKRPAATQNSISNSDLALMESAAKTVIGVPGEIYFTFRIQHVHWRCRPLDHFCSSAFDLSNLVNSPFFVSLKSISLAWFKLYILFEGEQ